jgi:hypothetical protein
MRPAPLRHDRIRLRMRAGLEIRARYELMQLSGNRNFSTVRNCTCVGKSNTRQDEVTFNATLSLPHPVKSCKRGSQEKYLSRRWIFSCFPGLVNEQGWFWPSAPWIRFGLHLGTAVWIFSPCGFHRGVVTNRVRSETDKQSSCQVPIMVLSEACGL